MFGSYIFNASARVVCNTGYARQRLTTSISPQQTRRSIDLSFLRFVSSKSDQGQNGQGKESYKTAQSSQPRRVKAAQNLDNRAIPNSVMKLRSKGNKEPKAHERGTISEGFYDSKTPRLVDRMIIPGKAITKELNQTLGTVEKAWELARQNRPLSPRLGTTSLDTVLLRSGWNRSEQAILEDRVYCILYGLINELYTKKEWEQFLQRNTIEEWAVELVKLFPSTVRPILAAPHPPHISDLESLGWEKTAKWGVYGYISKRTPENRLQPANSIYVGSATAVGWGLEGRKYDHLAEQRSSRRTTFILNNDLNENMTFFTLISFQAASLGKYDFMDARRLAVLAEAVLTVWLAAFDNNGKPLLRALCPWDRKQITYGGLCKHNPLVHSADRSTKRPGESSRQTWKPSRKSWKSSRKSWR